MTVTIEEAKERMEELARLAIGGEEVRITQGGVATVELKPVEIQPIRVDRKPGMWKGRFELGPEFSEPLPDDELDMWEGNSPRGRKLEKIGEAWAAQEREKANGSAG